MQVDLHVDLTAQSTHQDVWLKKFFEFEKSNDLDFGMSLKKVEMKSKSIIYSLGNFQFNQSEEGSLSQAELHSIPRFDFNLHCETTPDPEPFVDVESSERRGEIRRQQSTVPQILVDFVAALPRPPFLSHFQPDIQFLIESQKKPFPQKRKNFWIFIQFREIRKNSKTQISILNIVKNPRVENFLVEYFDIPL